MGIIGTPLNKIEAKCFAAELLYSMNSSGRKMGGISFDALAFLGSSIDVMWYEIRCVIILTVL